MPDPEKTTAFERKEKLRNVLIVAGAYAVSVLLYKLLLAESLGHTSLLFLGLPGVLAILLALAPRAGTAKGGIVKGITFALLILAPMVGEGYLCILVAAPLFYAVGLIVGTAIDHSRKKTTTLSCVAIVVLVFSLDGIVPMHSREEIVSVTRVVDASQEAVRARLAAAPDITRPLPRFLRAGFPRPIAVSGSGLAVGATRTVRFSGAEGDPPGDLTLRVEHATDNSLLFVAVGDSSKLTQWISWKSSFVQWQAVDATHTRVSWQTTFDRQLDPWWYFAPWERYAVYKATEYLVAANAEPSVRRGEVPR